MTIDADPACPICAGTGIDSRPDDQADGHRYISIQRDGKVQGYLCRCSHVESGAA